MSRYQLWKEITLDVDGNTVHPKMLYESRSELALLYRAFNLDLDPQQHYIVHIDELGKRVMNYSSDGPFRYLHRFHEWKGIKNGEVYTKGFIIQEASDTSVGIFGGQYTLNGDFLFQDKEELDGFRSKLNEAFEWVSDPLPSIITIEESELFIMMEDEQFSPSRPEGLND